MRRPLLVAAWLMVTILTTQANSCLLDASVDCGAVGARLQEEVDAMAATCESALYANEAVCAEATAAWNDTMGTWNDYCGGYRIVLRKIY